MGRGGRKGKKERMEVKFRHPHFYDYFPQPHCSVHLPLQGFPFSPETFRNEQNARSVYRLGGEGSIKTEEVAAGRKGGSLAPSLSTSENSRYSWHAKRNCNRPLVHRFHPLPFPCVLTVRCISRKKRPPPSFPTLARASFDWRMGTKKPLGVGNVCI